MKRISRLLLTGGSGVAVLAFSKWHATMHGYDYTGSTRFGWSVAYVLLLVTAAYGFGLPELPHDLRGRLGVGLGATGFAAASMSIIQLFAGDALLPRFVVFGSALGLAPWYALCSALSRNGANRAQRRDRVVVVGDRTETKLLTDELVDKPERPAALLSVVKIKDASARGPEMQPLLDRVAEHRATVVVLSRQAQVDETIVGQAAEIHARGVRVRSLLAFYEEWLGKLPITELERMSLMFDIGEIHGRVYLRSKRLFDLTLGSIGFLGLVVALPFVVAGNLISNRGPLFYRQERIGKNGMPFQIIKFRTMKPLGSTLVDEWTEEDDSRVTPFGRFLRKTHVDELAQIMNVLSGKLSMVGPRPEQPHYVSWLNERMPFYDFRHSVRPGITGWAQVKYGYAGDERDALEKLQYDFYYLRHQSLSLDCRIIIRTIRSVMGFRGR